MVCVAVNKKEVLSEANKLVSNGLRKAAIDLLLEYLESDQKSSPILSALGRAYLLDHQPDKAVVCLKKALELTQSNGAKDDNISEYLTDSFGDDDMAFVESQGEKFAEEDYGLEVDEPNGPTEKNETQRSSNDRDSSSIGPTEIGGLQSEDKKERIKIVYRGRRKTSIDTNKIPSSEHNDCNRLQDGLPKSSLNYADGVDRHAIPAGTNDSSIAEEKNGLPHPKNNAAVEIKPPYSTTSEGAAKQLGTDDHRKPDRMDDEDFELSEDEQPFSGELFEDNDNDEDEQVLDELLDLASFSPQEEEFDALSLDDFDDLDEFDELAHREIEEEVQSDGKVSRDVRARQVAVQVLHKSDWDLKYLSLLQQIFVENGWSAARTAIEKLIDEGIQPEELALARKVRRLWSGNEQYWITFHKIKYHARFQQTDAAYKNLSWPESLRIINCFPSLPDIEEIYAFIDEVFDHWYNSKNLRRIFPAFFKFLKYRTDSIRRALPGETVFSFLNYENANTGVDSDRFGSSISPESQRLSELGAQLNQWPQPPENKIKILKESEK